MLKKTAVIPLFLLSFSQVAFSNETMNYNEVPVITGEFEVEQKGQKQFANLPKDTPEIQVESDILGLKKFYENTFDTKKIKQRFSDGLERLQEPDSDVIVDKKQR